MLTTETLLTVEQAATRLNVHPITVRRHLRSGLLRGVKRGHLWRIPESALIEPAPKAPKIEAAPKANYARALELGEQLETQRKQSPASPLARALEMIKARDVRVGHVAIRTDGDVASDLRAVREAQTP